MTVSVETLLLVLRCVGLMPFKLRKVAKKGTEESTAYAECDPKHIHNSKVEESFVVQGNTIAERSVLSTFVSVILFAVRILCLVVFTLTTNYEAYFLNTTFDNLTSFLWDYAWLLCDIAMVFSVLVHSNNMGRACTKFFYLRELTRSGHLRIKLIWKKLVLILLYKFCFVCVMAKYTLHLDASTIMHSVAMWPSMCDYIIFIYFSVVFMESMTIIQDKVVAEDGKVFKEVENIEETEGDPCSAVYDINKKDLKCSEILLSNFHKREICFRAGNMNVLNQNPPLNETDIENPSSDSHFRVDSATGSNLGTKFSNVNSWNNSNTHLRTNSSKSYAPMISTSNVFSRKNSTAQSPLRNRSSSETPPRPLSTLSSNPNKAKSSIRDKLVPMISTSNVFSRKKLTSKYPYRTKSGSESTLRPFSTLTSNSNKAESSLPDKFLQSCRLQCLIHDVVEGFMKGCGMGIMLLIVGLTVSAGASAYFSVRTATVTDTFQLDPLLLALASATGLFVFVNLGSNLEKKVSLHGEKSPIES